jgi:hypothetical protein
MAGDELVRLPATELRDLGDWRAALTTYGACLADIRVASLERSVAAWLAQADGACILVNSASRVLLSNSVRYNVGVVLPTEAHLSFTEVGRFRWLIGRATNNK